MRQALQQRQASELQCNVRLPICLGSKARGCRQESLNLSFIVVLADRSSLAVSYEDIVEASRVLAGVAHRTPVLTSRQANERAGAELFFKCENFQRTGCSGFRGAYSVVSRIEEARKHLGVVTSSLGNHGQAVALSSKLCQIPALVLVPSDAPKNKIASMQRHGAQVVFYERMFEDGEAIAEEHALRFGRILIPLCDHKDIIAGQGTAAKELIEEVGPLDYLFVPTGSGSLLAGSAIASAHLSPACKVIGIEPQAGNDAQQSLESGALTTIPMPFTLADGARHRRVGKLALPILQAHVQQITTVSDNNTRWQVRFFAEKMKIVTEPTACLAAAAVLRRVIDVSGKRVGIIVSGGNIDSNIFKSCLTADEQGRV